MSLNAALPSSSTTRQPTWSFRIQNFSTPQTYAAKSAVESKGNQTPSTSTQTTSVAPVGKASQPDTTDEQSKMRLVKKRRRLNKEEEDMKNEIAASVAANLEMDQILTLYPDTDTPFKDEMDVVQRLLPYHIYQQPRHDLDKMRGLKGKAKVNKTELLKEEINETKFALDCHKRFRELEQRMRRTRLKAGQSAIPLDQAILVERMMLETEHSDKTILERELSDARSELDKVLRAQRLAKAAANRPTASVSASGPTSINGTNSTTPFYGFNTPTFSTAPSSGYSNYYSSYTYPYAQSFISGMRFTTPTKSTTPSVPGASSFQTGAAGQTTTAPSSSSANQTSTLTSSTTATARPPPVAIPLQLPVTSLPALQSLGILPVPKASVPEDANAQPAAVLLGTSNNGTMLSLEINAALLQPPQMSGLAILLSSLVKMSGGSNNSGQNSGQAPASSAAGAVHDTSGSIPASQPALDTGDKSEKGK